MLGLQRFRGFVAEGGRRSQRRGFWGLPRARAHDCDKGCVAPGRESRCLLAAKRLTRSSSLCAVAPGFLGAPSQGGDRMASRRRSTGPQRRLGFACPRDIRDRPLPSFAHRCARNSRKKFRRIGKPEIGNRHYSNRQVGADDAAPACCFDAGCGPGAPIRAARFDALAILRRRMRRHCNA